MKWDRRKRKRGVGMHCSAVLQQLNLMLRSIKKDLGSSLTFCESGCCHTRLPAKTSLPSHTGRHKQGQQKHGQSEAVERYGEEERVKLPGRAETWTQLTGKRGRPE